MDIFHNKSNIDDHVTKIVLKFFGKCDKKILSSIQSNLVEKLYN